MKLAIVTTTINVPELLDGYCRDSAEHGRKDICCVVVGDRKTPAEAQAFCENLEKVYGYRVEYFGVDRQKEYLASFPELDQYLPWNSVQRRNAGMVYAYEIGSDVILTIDDDNYLLEPNLLEKHLRVGTKQTLKSYASSNGWMNPCQFLTAKPDILFYHRGFPMSKRFVEAELAETLRTGRVAVNVGMWIGDPDVDAWVRMTLPLEATKWNADANFTLGPGTWAPFNSQQTALAREALPAYFLNPNAGRFDDIWGSFLLHRIANHLDDLISYGSPIVAHLQKRSLASLWRDIEDERIGTLLNDDFAGFLRELKLTASSYEGCYAEIADAAEAWIGRCNFPAAQKGYIDEYVRGMRVWMATFARVTARAGHAAELVR